MIAEQFRVILTLSMTLKKGNLVKEKLGEVKSSALIGSPTRDTIHRVICPAFFTSLLVVLTFRLRQSGSPSLSLLAHVSRPDKVLSNTQQIVLSRRKSGQKTIVSDLVCSTALKRQEATLSSVKLKKRDN